MQELRQLAKQLLAEKKVDLVIGYEEGPRGVRPAFADTPEKAERLIFDARCLHNLASYLNPRRKHLGRYGRKAVIVKGCDAKAVAGLIRENQLQREAVVLIGVRCGGVARRPDHSGPLSEASVADRCGECDLREPKLVDHLLGPLPPAPPLSQARRERMAKLEKMPAAERLQWWLERLQDCLRCHACREVCPMCYCERCLADKSMPQWVESSPHARANFSWHFARALHQAGRCVDCGECERVCPSAIPLTLINRKISQIVAERFGHTASDDPAKPSPIGEFRLDDKQEFIK